MSGEVQAKGVLYLVATPIGNLEDITYRAVRVLGEADLVAAEDTRSARRLLDHYGIRPSRLVSYFEGNEAQRAPELVAELEGGARVALISEAGTPGVSDPGYRVVCAAAAAGVRVEPVPGPSAAIAALVASALPTDRFEFLGFPPREPGRRRQLFGELRARPATLVLYEAPDRVGATLADLRDAFGAGRQAAVARELTKLYEEVVRGSLGELAGRYGETGPRGECVIVVAGAPPGADAPSEVDVEAAVRELLAQGLGPKDIAARLVVTTGKPRRQLYQLALALGRERSSE